MLTLEAALYRHVGPIPSEGRRISTRVANTVGELLGREIASATADIKPSEVALNLCVSTMMDLPFATGWLSWEDIVRAASAYTKHPPQNFTASYECAGWGFALDYARRRCWPDSIIILTVMDLNLFDISFWRHNEAWGRSGFGISTVVFRVPKQANYPIEVGVAKSNYCMGEFCAALRKWMIRSPSKYANVPFLPQSMIGIYTHFLPEHRILPNLHTQYGHCFGSDTWLSYITSAIEGLIEPENSYTATSASLRGYWTMTDICVAKGARFAISSEAPLVDGRRSC